MAGRILYMTDKFKVSPAYGPAFDNMLRKCNLTRGTVVTTDIYNLVKSPLRKKANEKLWRFDPEKYDEIKAAFDQRINTIKPTVIVVSCPAVIAVLADGDIRAATIEKMRGGVYYYRDIPCIVTYPITAIHKNVDTRAVENEDGERDSQQPYKVKDGAQILMWDWQKISRFYHGKTRKLPPFRYSICRTLDDLFAARDYLAECVLIASDIETGNYPPGITCAGYCGLHRSGSVHSFVIPLYDEYAEGGTFWDSEDEHAIALSVIADINDSPVIKTFQNGVYDCSYFIRDCLPVRNYLLDSQYMWHSLYMELPKKLGFISSILCDNYQYWKDDIKGDEESDSKSGNDSKAGSMERYWRYNAQDCYYTLWDTIYLWILLRKNPKHMKVFVDAMQRAFNGLGMSMRGVKADFARRDYHRANLVEAMNTNQELLRFMLDTPDFNINSTDDKKWMLYELFGLRERTARGRFVDPKKDRTGDNAPSAGKLPLKLAKPEHPLFRAIIETLEAALEPRVQMSNIFGTPDESATGGVRGGLFLPTGRFRTAFNPCGTETTRFSSKKSNFWDGGNAQNLRGTYKDWIVADEDCVFLDIDYSQSDDVFIAYESQDPDKIRVIEDKLDAHAYNGELFFGVPYDEIVRGKKAKESWCVHPITGVRQNAKRAGHGSNFQMAAMTLYVTMGREAVIACAHVLGYSDAHTWDQTQLVALCDRLMAKYRKRYKRLTAKEWYKEIADDLKRTGKITNCFDITRSFLGDPNDNGTQREATAYIGQSATAGNMNRVMDEINLGKIPESFRDGPNADRYEKPLMMNWESHGFAFHLQVHDNFLIQLNLKHPRWREAAHNVLQVMNRPITIHGREVRVTAEAELGLRWGKGMLEWDGDCDNLDRLVAKLKHG